MQHLTFVKKSEKNHNAFLFAVFVRTSTFFGFFISLTHFRVFCLFRCWFLLRCLQQQNVPFLNERAVPFLFLKIPIQARYRHTVLSFEARYFYDEQHQPNCICSIFRMLYGGWIIAEFSLQSASQNSRKINQRQSWSQIR